MKINEKLRAARVKSGLTQEKVAEKIMVSRQTISNWENAKSLPDIVSVINMSTLYELSLDELLKGDQQMKEKVEKDAKNLKGNKRLILITGILSIIFALTYFVSVYNGGEFYDFSKAAAPWIIIGIGVAFTMAYYSQEK